MKQFLKWKSVLLISAFVLFLSGCSREKEQLAFLHIPSSAGGAAAITVSTAGTNHSDAASVSNLDSSERTGTKESTSSKKEKTSSLKADAFSSGISSEKEEELKQKLAEKEKEYKELERNYTILKAAHEHELYSYQSQIGEAKEKLEQLKKTLKTDQETLDELIKLSGGGISELYYQLTEKIETEKKEIAALETEISQLNQKRDQLENDMAEAKYHYTVMREMLKKEIDTLSGK